MKRSLLAATAVALFFAAPSAHASAVGTFDGTMKFTSASSSCAWRAGKFAIAIYLVPNLGTNDARSVLTTFAPTDLVDAEVNHFELQSGSIYNSGHMPVTMDETWTTASGSGTISSAVTITSQVPTAPLSTTHTLSLKGTIAGIGADPTCKVGFDATLNSFPPRP